VRTWLADESELDTVARLLGEFRDWFGNTTPTDGEMRESAARIRAADGEYLLGAVDAEPVGVCQVRYRWSVWTTGEDAWLEDVFVRDAARGSGLGRALVEAAIERARERGCARIELDADEANTPAMTLYRSLGFRDDLKAEARSLLLGLRLR
jgi:GNAT superfamily N-acetyltransferase